MTTIRSGFFETPSNTPFAEPKKIAVDNPYLTKDDFINSIEASGLGLTPSSTIYTNGQLDKILLRSSAWINRHCRRWFDTQTIDETKTGIQVRPYNPQLVTVVLQNSPYQRIHSVYIQVLKWFIEVDITSPGNYLQDFPDLGYYKIVPVLSSAGTGVGSPIPAAILDRVALGVLWTRYTFGYGTSLSGQTLTDLGSQTAYQAVIGNRLWAPDQTTKIYVNAVEVTSGFTINYPNGIVTFTTPNAPGDVITADFVTNESVPEDLKEATILLASHMIGQGQSNPLGADSMSIQTFSISFGGKGKVKERVEELLSPYVNKMPMIV